MLPIYRKVIGSYSVKEKKAQRRQKFTDEGVMVTNMDQKLLVAKQMAILIRINRKFHD